MTEVEKWIDKKLCEQREREKQRRHRDYQVESELRAMMRRQGGGE